MKKKEIGKKKETAGGRETKSRKVKREDKRMSETKGNTQKVENKNKKKTVKSTKRNLLVTMILWNRKKTYKVKNMLPRVRDQYKETSNTK